MAFAFEPKSKGDEEKAASALRRLSEEDPTLDVHRDPETGEQIIAGLTQIHVEVIVDRIKERFGAEIELHPPHVPYIETIRKSAKAHGRYKKQTGGRGQFADCRIEIEPQETGEGFEFENAIKGGVIPGGFIPAVEKGIVEAMAGGELAGYPMKDVKVRLYDGQHHSVDSSEMAFKIAGSMAFKQAVAEADAVPAGADHADDDLGARGRRRRRHRGSQLAPRPAAGDGAQGNRRPRSKPRSRWPRCSTTLRTCARSPAGVATTRWSSSATRKSRATSPRRSSPRPRPPTSRASGPSPSLVPERVVVNVDGGARGNPGPAAVAAVAATPEGDVIERRGETIGTATNNVAEYRALLLGIALAREHGASEVELVGDSELVVKQVKGEYRVKDAGLRPLHAQVRAALEGFERWSIRHVRREQNAEADHLVNETLDEAAG